MPFADRTKELALRIKYTIAGVQRSIYLIYKISGSCFTWLTCELFHLRAVSLASCFTWLTCEPFHLAHLRAVSLGHFTCEPFHLPVLPNPPSPRRLSGSASTTCTFANVVISLLTTCTRRSPAFTTTSRSSVFHRAAMSSPR